MAIDQALELELKIPNAETRAAMEESRSIMISGNARFSNSDELFDAIEKKQQRVNANFSELLDLE